MTTPNPTPVEQTAPPTPSVAAPAPSPADKAAASKRKPWLIALTVIFVLAGVAYGIYWFIYAKFFIDTDNAYVSGNVVQITPQTAGTVIGVNADDTDFVQTGQVLITLDRADAQLALDAAQTQLAQTIREVKSVFAGDATAQAVVAQRQEDVARSTADLARRQSLAGTGAVAGEEIAHARDMVKEAQTALNTAREQAAANRSFTDHTTPRTHPNVQRAVLKVREAQLALERTTVASPITGYVAHRTAQPGQRVNIGMPLMAVIPLDQLWVDANFKEGQLADMRIGQPVEMHADVYGSDVGLPRPRDRLRGGHRFGLLAAASAKCHRQLDQGRAAAASAYRARSARSGQTSIAHRSVDACRCRYA